MPNHLLRQLALIFWIASSIGGAHLSAQPKSQATRPDVVSRYIRAIQQEDYKTVIDLTYSYQQEVAQIKAANPQVLWPKLIGDYYQNRIASLSATPGYWQSYAEALLGEPTQDIRVLQVILPPSCSWKITESRRDSVRDSIPFGPYERLTVFVTVEYSSVAKSPEFGNRFLKQTILQFIVNAKSQLVMAVGRLPQGDTYWSRPYPKDATPFLREKYKSAFENAQNLRDAQSAIHELIGLGWDVAEPILLEAMSSRWRFYTASLPMLAEQRSNKAVPVIATILREKFTGKSKEPGCDETSILLVSTLAQIGSHNVTDIAQLLREALSSTISADLGLSGSSWTAGRDNRKCADQYLEALAAIDNPAWGTFPYWYSGEIKGTDGTYSGGSVFWKILDELNYLPRSPRLVANPGVSNIIGQLRACGRDSGWRCSTVLVADKVILRSPFHVELAGSLLEYDSSFRQSRIRENFKLDLRRSGAEEKAWAISGTPEGGLAPNTSPRPPSRAGFYPPMGDSNARPSFGWLGNNPSFPNNPIHLGTDFPKGYGEPVYSMAGGKVILVRVDVGKYGGLEQVGGGMFVEYRTQTDQTFYALYAHVENMKLEGSCVKPGEQIATVGHYFYDKEGKDDRPHLHLAVFFGDELPSGEGWPWRQYVSDRSDAPGWQDPLFVLENMRPGASPCDSLPQPQAQIAEEPKPDIGPPKAVAPLAPERQIQSFRVKHRHMGPDARGNVSFVASYCEGELRVIPEGYVEYICGRADTVRGRCERGRFPPIKQVVLRDDGGLRITLIQGGNWDFYGSGSDIKTAYEAVSKVVSKP